MREAWYVVETYCLVYSAHAVLAMLRFRNEYMPLALSLLSLLCVLTFSWLTYKGKRLASILLSLHILGTALYSSWAHLEAANTSSVYLAYLLLIEAYFITGSVKLLLLKKLPTRFTDPPAEPTAHA